MGALIEVGVLGPLEVSVDGVRVTLGGERARLLFCRLLVDRGHPVPAWRLRDDVWDGHDGSDGVVKMAVSRLRAALSPASASLRREDAGYSLARGDVVIDADRFESLVAEARATTDPAASAELYAQALALWRGEPFGELGTAAFLVGHAGRLVRQRMLAEEERFERLLAAGRHAELLPELHAADASGRPRERVTMALALALYRCGHQLDALEAMHRTARRLRDDHGITPSDEFRRFEHALLVHDPTLLLAPARLPDDGRAAALAQLEASERGADALLAAGAPGEAVRLALRAVDTARRLGDDGALATALARAARTLALAERGAEAAPLLDEATAIARRCGDAVALAHAAMVRFGQGAATDDGDGLLAVLAEPLALLPPDAPVCVDLLCAAMHQLVQTADSPGADALLDRAERLAERTGEPRAVAVARTARAVLAPLRGESLARQRQLADAALDAVTRSGDPSLRVVALHGQARTLLEAGRLDRLAALSEEFAVEAVRSPYPFAWLRSEMLRHAVDLARGDIDGLEGRIAGTLARGQRMGVTSATGTTTLQFVLCWFEEDRLADLRRVVTARRSDFAGEPTPWDALEAMLDAHLDPGPAVLDRVRSLVVARHWADMRHPARRLAPPLLLEAAVTLLDRLGGAAADAAGLAGDLVDELAPDAGRFLVIGHATGCFGPADRLRGLGLAAAGRLDDGVAALEEAHALAAAGGARLWADRTALGLARVLRTRRGPGDAERAAALVRAVERSPTVASSLRLARELAAALPA